MKKIILLLSLLPLYLFSQNKIHDGYLYYLNQYASYKDDKMQITMNYDVKIHWKFWTLMGEPVMIAQMIWAPTLVQKKINGIDTNLNVETNKELLEKLRVYEFIVDAKLKQSVNSAYVLSSLKTLGEVQIDTGVGTFPFSTKLVSNILDVNLNSIENQFKSYNVAGSKDWDKLLKIGNTFATKQKVIEYFKQDKILFDTAGVVSAKVDFSSLATHYANTQAQILKNKEIEKQKKAQETELEKIKQEESKIVQQKENLNDSLESLFEEKNIEKMKNIEQKKRVYVQKEIKVDSSKIASIDNTNTTYTSKQNQKLNTTNLYIEKRKKELQTRAIKPKDLIRYKDEANKSCTYKDEFGNTILKFATDSCLPFSDGLAIIYINKGEWIAIDASGTEVMNLTTFFGTDSKYYIEPDSFHNGYLKSRVCYNYRTSGLFKGTTVMTSECKDIVIDKNKNIIYDGRKKNEDAILSRAVNGGFFIKSPRYKNSFKDLVLTDTSLQNICNIANANPNTLRHLASVDISTLDNAFILHDYMGSKIAILIPTQGCKFVFQDNIFDRYINCKNKICSYKNLREIVKFDYDGNIIK